MLETVADDTPFNGKPDDSDPQGEIDNTYLDLITSITSMFFSATFIYIQLHSRVTNGNGLFMSCLCWSFVLFKFH